MPLFDSVLFYLSTSLPDQRREELTYRLVQHGAKQVDSVIDASHVITDTNKFEGCQDVTTRIAVVTDKWVEYSIELQKLQSPIHYSPDPAMIFSGVVACATELPASDVEILTAAIPALGGQWRTALTRDVTHLFCVSNTSPKYATALHFKETTGVRIILPHWFDDSVRLGYRDLPMEPYEWPDPPLLQGPDQLTEQMSSKKGSTNPDLPSRNVVLSLSQLTDGQSILGNIPGLDKNVWNGRRILLSPSLDLSPSRQPAIEAAIVRCGGVVVPYLTNLPDGGVGDCDVFVTRWRSGRAYVKAVKENKTIGTLGWIFCVHATGVVTRPLDQLLHYPIPKRLIEGFSNQSITVTNYTGEAREYLKKLITTMGATFTPSMSGKNTVLIAAYMSGIKTTKAVSWSIPIVNHTWLEDCFVQWRNLTVGTEKYIFFPPGMDFSKLLGERGVGGGFTIARAERGHPSWVCLESDDELDELEKEDDGMSEGGEAERALVIGQRELLSVKNAQRASLALHSASPATQGSAEAREVEAEITIVEEVLIPTKGEGKEVTRKSGPENDDSNDDIEIIQVEQAITPSKPIARKRSIAIAVDIPQSSSSKKVSGDVEVVPKQETPRKRGRPRKVKPEPEQKAGPKQTSVTQRKRMVVLDEDESEPRPTRSKAGRARSSGKYGSDTGGDSDVATKNRAASEPQRSTNRGKGKKKSREEDDDDDEPIRPRPKTSVNSRTSKGVTKGKQKMVVKREEEEESNEDEKLPSSSLKSSRRPATPPSTDDDEEQGNLRGSSPLSAPPSSPPKISATARTSRRSAAVRATQRLHDEVMPDMNNYENARRKGRISLSVREEQVLKEAERSASVGVSRKRKANGADIYDDSDGSEPERKKKPRVSFNESTINPSKEKGASSNIRLLTTMVTLSDNVTKALTKLGVKFTANVMDCTHMIAPRIVRTEKFLCALGSGRIIVSEEWANKSATAKTLLPEKKYTLHDEAGEQKFGFKLAEALGRARATKIFAGKTFYVTPKVAVGMQLMKNVITACGGQFLTTTPTVRILNANPNRHVVSCPEDASIWRPISGHFPVYNQELILTGTLKQLVDWNDQAFRVVGSY